MAGLRFVNGIVRTPFEQADWVTVEDGRIAGVGIGEPPEAARTVDLAGGCLVPAFCDPHVHLTPTGLYSGGLDFRGVRRADEIVAALGAHARRPDAVLFGGNFEDPLDRPLTRRDLDAAVGERPAMVARADMHSCVVSSALLRSLELSGTAGVDREPDGEPTGYLREQAACAAWRWFETALPADQQRAAIRAAARRAYARGVTTVHEMYVVEWRGWGAYELLTGTTAELALDVVFYLATDEVDKVAGLGHRCIGGDWFLDGSFGSHTAWLRAPYAEPPPPGSPQNGISYRDDDEVFRFFASAQEAGLQVGVHAIGDAAIEQAVRAWERVAAGVGRDAIAGLRHRIEHFECADDDLVSRASALGLAASVQPAFDLYWGGVDGLYARRIGAQRAAGMNRFRSMLAAGLVLGAGSDSTVTPLDPLLQMRALRAHHQPDQRLDGLRALAACTAWAHDLTPWRGRRGRLKPGTPADLTWLERDPVDCPPEELEAIGVAGTWARGLRVWPPEEAEAP